MNNQNLIIFTPSPAIDLYFDTANDGTSIRFTGRSSAGKGVNLARTLAALGLGSVCCLPLGEDNLEEYISGLDLFGKVDYRFTPLSGKTRENRHINRNGDEQPMWGEGIALGAEDIRKIFEEINKILTPTDVFCLCGSIPKGTDKAELISQLRAIKARGAELVIDTRSFTAEEIGYLYPSLIKPNKDEAEKYLSDLGLPAGDISALRTLAKRVLITKGGEGAMLLGDEDLACTVPRVDVRCTVGAGDSALAGFVYSKLSDSSDAEALRFATACGSASCLSDGTLPPHPCEIKRLYEALTVTKI